MKFTTAELGTAAILEGLPEWQLAWFADHGTRLDLATGDRMFERGEPSDYMFIVIEGAIQRHEEVGGQWLVVATTRQGEVTGMLPYSRMKQYPGYTVAVEPSKVLRIGKGDFKEMLLVSQEVGRRLVAVMSDRVRGDVRLEQQRERMVALGRLSAGLAHELNNPAAAVSRAAAGLAEQLGKLAPAALAMMSRGMDEKAAGAVEALRHRLANPNSPTLSPLERSEREEDLTAWLEGHDVVNAWDLAEALVEAGVTGDDLEDLMAGIPAPIATDALTWVAGGAAADRMVAEIASSAERISKLVASVKTYSHMDRSPEHKPTDVREGIDNTLTMLGHKFKKKNIQLTRDYEEEPAVIPANAGELNQVWTNLIDNALDAMDGDGHLQIKVRRRDDSMVIQVIDDGHGIPDDVRARMFEPFFTTKAMGEGTGLGLDIAMRIVKTHCGAIDVQSKPGQTEFRVVLPVSRTAPSSG